MSRRFPGKKELFLPLKRQWFSMIDSLEKREEYREDKPFWQKRLDGKKFDIVTFSYGYTKKTISFECLGITKGFGKPEWGGKEGTVCFVIKIGNRL